MKIITVYDFYMEKIKQTSNEQESLGIMLQEIGVSGRILVDANHYRCFSQWCSRRGILPTNRSIRFINSSRDVRGYSAMDGTFVLNVCGGARGLDVRVPRARSVDLQEMYMYIAMMRELGMEIRYDDCVKPRI